ncbi:MAG: hypothetical protein K2X38_01445 [Gemmataceae bacterium]|nr:hypothetical protein [Gemmataceae bacterium]
MENWRYCSEHHFDMGRFVAVWNKSFLWGAIIFAGGLVGIPALLMRGDSHLRELLVFGAIGLGFIVLIQPFIWRLRFGVRKVVVFDEGIAWGAGAVEEWCPWSDIREVWRYDIFSLQRSEDPNDWNRSSLLRLVLHEGRELRFNHSLTDYDQLAQQVQQFVTSHLLAETDPADGKIHAFGPVEITPKGLRMFSQDYAWSEISNFAISNGSFCFYGRGHLMQLHLSIIPNYQVLLGLLERLGHRIHLGLAPY